MVRPQRGTGQQPQPGTSQPEGEAAQKNPNSGRSLRNQIRGVERLLKRADLSSEAREVQEAKLAELHARAQQKAHSDLERKMTLRYRRVRAAWEPWRLQMSCRVSLTFGRHISNTCLTSLH